MADWTTIPDTTFEPGAPAKGRDMRFLRDNPIAIAEGAAGAPRVQAAALGTDNNMRDWVLARIAGASINAVGTYRMAYYRSSTQLSPGGTASGSALRVRPETSINEANQFNVSTENSLPSDSLPGAWRLMGHHAIAADLSVGSSPMPAAFWLRVS